MNVETIGGCGDPCSSLLPWFVNGRLGPDEAAQVRAHLAGCAECRREQAELESLQATLHVHPRLEHSPQPALDRLWSRIDEMDREIAAAEEAGQATARRADNGRVIAPRWLVAAVVVQAAGLGLLGSLLWSRSGTGEPEAAYHTLSAPAASVNLQPRLRVVFAPSATLEEVGTLLRQLGAQVVTGPSEGGTYALGLEDSSQAAIAKSLSALRSDRRVVFAEPIVDERPATR